MSREPPLAVGGEVDHPKRTDTGASVAEAGEVLSLRARRAATVHSFISRSTRQQMSTQVRCADETVPGIARRSFYAHSMLLCVRHAGVQSRSVRRSAPVHAATPTANSCASSVQCG